MIEKSDDVNKQITEILQSTLEGFWIVNQFAEIIEVNDTYLKMIGYYRDEFKNIKIFDVEAIEDPDATGKHIEKIIREGNDIFETRHRCKDGSIIIVEISVSYLQKNGGEFFCFIKDITQQKRTEALLNARINLSNLAQTSDLDTLIRSALDIAEDITESSIGFFHFVNPDQESLKLQTWSTNTIAKMCTAEGKGQHYPISHAGIWVDCVRTKTAVIHNDYASMPNKKGIPQGHAPIIRELTVPILKNDSIIAIIGVGNKKTIYVQDDIDAVLILSSMAIDLVERKKMEDELLKSNKELEERITERTESLKLANIELQNSFNKLQSLAELNQIIISNSPLGKIVYKISDGKCIVVNDAALFMLNTNKTSILEKTLFTFKLWKQTDFKNFISEVLNKRTDLKQKITIELDNKQKQFEISFTIFTWNQESHILLCFEDITFRMQMNTILMESEEKFRIAFQNAPYGMSITNPEGKYIAVNPQLCNMFGYTEDELMSGDISIVTHPDDIELSKEWIKKKVNGQLCETELEKRYIHKNGSIVWGLVRAEWIKSSEGYPLMSIVHIADITERKKIIIELQESEEKFRSLFENITEGVALHEMVYDAHGKAIDYRLIDVNSAYTDHTGLHLESAKNKLATEVYGTTEPPYFTEFSLVAENRNPIKFETYFPPMEKYFTISVVSPKKGQFATVFEDITANKKREQEIIQKNEELTRFIYTVSHDLKSPLVTIKAFTSYLQEDLFKNDTEAQNTDIRYIQNAADKMGRLLEELLELSRVGRKENAKTEVSLADLAQEAIDLVAGRIIEAKIDVTINNPDVMIYGDSRRIVQMYQNLIDNSAKYIGNPENPRIEIGAIKPQTKNDEVVLYVKDNGSGIDQRYHHKVFGLFEKIDTTKDGTGIGLALVKRIVEVHNGKIWFKSDGEGKGTIFYFTFERTKWNN